MAIQTEPTRIQIPFADSGTKNTIPDTNSTPSASQAASWTDGFPAQCSLPLSAGGIPPARADFNGIFNAITQSERFTQEGGVWEWDATVDYGTDRLVLGSDGLLYWSIAQSGPNVGGAQDPTADTSHTYWQSPAVPTMPSDDSSEAAASTAWVNNWLTDHIQPASNYYVDPVNGDDNNDGLSLSSAKKTIASAFSVVYNSPITKLSGVTINLADGTYNENILSLPNGFSLIYKGPSSGFASVRQGAFHGEQNASVMLSGRIQFSKQIRIARNTSVYLDNDSYIKFNNVSDEAALMLYQRGALTMQISSSANITLEFSGTNTFSDATVSIDTQSSINIQSVGLSIVTSGTVSGKRYRVERCSGAGRTGSTTFFPGSSNGTTDTTSYYY